MALTKRTYVDNQTIITAENMNAIQDAIIALEKNTPTKTSQLNNDRGFQTAAQVTAAIDAALGVIENGSY